MWIKTSKQYREETSRKISWGHWFAFFNILWAIILGARYAFIMDWPDTLFGKLYFSLAFSVTSALLSLHFICCSFFRWVFSSKMTALFVASPSFSPQLVPHSYWSIAKCFLASTCTYLTLFGIYWSILRMVSCHGLGKFSLPQCHWFY